jgi:hypothetical protein
MGFRVPLTAAEEVDTTLDGRQPGVKIYTRGGNPSAGVVDWHAGFATRRAELVSSDTGSGGERFTLGSPDGLLGLELNEEELAEGGYETHAKLRGERVTLHPGGRTRRIRDSGWIDLNPVAPWVRGVDKMGYRVIDDVCYFAIHAQYNAPLPYPANTWVTTLPLDVLPSRMHWFTSIYNDSPTEFKIMPNGRVQVTFSKAIAGTVCSGSFPIG